MMSETRTRPASKLRGLPWSPPRSASDGQCPVPASALAPCIPRWARGRSDSNPEPAEIRRAYLHAPS